MMMHEDARKELARLLELVETRLVALPRPTWDSRVELRQAVQELQYDLEQEGARFGEISNNYTVSLAGVRASSTIGLDSALHNWCVGVRKRIGGAS